MKKTVIVACALVGALVVRRALVPSVVRVAPLDEPHDVLGDEDDDDNQDH